MNKKNIPILKVNGPLPEDSYTAPKQSANALFHFVKNIDYLFDILKNRAIIPRYCIEIVRYLDISIDKIAYPMLCFCDIKLHSIAEHMEWYGNYGIAFSKKWCINKCIQAVQYINSMSLLRNDFTEAFNNAIKANIEYDYQDYLLSHMYYLKPIEGSMIRDGKEIYKNFTDECEWRYIPNIRNINLPQAVVEDEFFSINILNQALRINDCCWLKYDWDDIKYIIVKTQEDYEILTDVIEEQNIEKNSYKKIFSKILVWDNIGGDL